MANYVEILQKKGKFVQKFKEPGEGRVENRYLDRETQETKVNYHKIFDEGITGKLTDIRFLPEGKFGKLYSFTLDVDGDYYIIQLRGKTKWGRLDSYTVDFIRRVANLLKGETYTVSPYAVQKEGDKYPNYGISFYRGGDTDDKTPYTLWFKSETNPDGQIPDKEVTEEMDLGKPVQKTNYTNQNNFLHAHLMNFIKNEFSSNSGGSVKSEPKQEPATKESTPNEDDLPF